jgi:S1-C subfamily serine protease
MILASNVWAANTIPQIVSHAKQSIIEIGNIDPDGNLKSVGTGFFVSGDGLAITNYHVIKGASRIMGLSTSGANYLFERVFFVAPHADLVVLKFYAVDVPYLRLGSSQSAVEGQHILVIGNPGGLQGTVSDGLISAFREDRSYMQITAPISPGSSGSPVLDDEGTVIGVAVSQMVEGQNLNFAIPVEKLEEAWRARSEPGDAASPPATATGPAPTPNSTPLTAAPPYPTTDMIKFVKQFVISGNSGAESEISFYL